MIPLRDKAKDSSSAVQPTLAARVTLGLPRSDEAQLIAGWLNSPETNGFLLSSSENLAFLASPRPGSGQRAIRVDGRLVGYLRWYPVWSEVSLCEELRRILPASTLQIEAFIGDPSDRGLGIGSRAIRLLRELLRELHGTNTLLALSSAHYFASRRAFEKAGLRQHFFYEDPERGPMVAMVRLVAPEQDDPPSSPLV